MNEMVERLMLLGYPEDDAEMIIARLIDKHGYIAALEYVNEKERELYVY